MHGYAASLPEMKSSFFMMGRALRLKGDLGTIDMRQIAPTLAQLMQVSFPSAEMSALSR
jgi:hypothetical protein